MKDTSMLPCLHACSMIYPVLQLMFLHRSAVEEHASRVSAANHKRSRGLA